MDSKIKELMKMFPECVIESRDQNGNLKHSIDFEILRQILGDEISDDPEAYRFDWVGKNSARIDAYRKIDKTLRPDLDSSLNFDSTENLYIEGDNLDVLKLLQQSYFKKIKLIYIDPPYNTGHDFIYKDRFEMDSDEYADRIDLFDENGNRKFVENSDSNPRFHSDWCSMIYSRLLLARNLLSDDGVIFISIDDNEQSNLKKICDEVFGERNFVATFPWRKRSSKSDVPHGISQDFEWVICYAMKNFLAGREFNRKYFESEDFPGRPWRIAPLSTHRTASERPNSFFTMINPKNGDEYPANPNGVWRVTKDTFEKYINQNKIIFPGDYDFIKNSKPMMRHWKSDDQKKAGETFGLTAVSTKFPDEIGMSQDGTKESIEIFGGKVFSFPKPIALIKFFLKISADSDSIILDFFSGSATTAHAVMQLNSEDHGNRKFIMVQLPEICPENSEAYKSGFNNICEIGKERIRRAGSNFENIDRGFRVLKLDSTNFRDVSISPEELTREKLFDLIENIKSDRSPLDLLFECLIDWGIELNLKLELEEFEGSMILNYNSGDLIACFDKNISKSVIEFIAKKNPNRVVFRDESFSSDSDKINSREIFKLHSPNTRFKVI